MITTHLIIVGIFFCILLLVAWFIAYVEDIPFPETCKDIFWIVPLVTVGWGIFWLLLQIFGEDFSPLILPCLYFVVLSVWILSWRLRKHKAGSLLLHVGATEETEFSRRLSFASLIILGCFLLFLVGTRNRDLMWQLLPLATMYITWIIFDLRLGFSKFELRQNGICCNLQFFPWRKIGSYELKQGKSAETDCLDLKIKAKPAFLQKSMRITFPKAYRAELVKILEQHLASR